jgi:predicted TIM-barrel fold metal-dependent hydrolase
VRY